MDGPQPQSAEFLHEDGITYRIRRKTLKEDFTIYEKHDGEWVDCGLDHSEGGELQRVQAPA